MIINDSVTNASWDYEASTLSAKFCSKEMLYSPAPSDITPNFHKTTTCVYNLKLAHATQVCPGDALLRFYTHET